MYDTRLFLDIVESIEGIRFKEEIQVGDICQRFYVGLNGDLVQLDASYEDMDNELARDFLHDLGLGHLCPAMLPNTPVVQIKIGASVFHLDTGVKYCIVADCNTPFNHSSKGDIYPEKGFDFVLMEEDSSEEKLISVKKSMVVQA